MQLELKAMQRETGTTFVYVTHDQEEALTMSDRIAVMNGGVVEQLAGPRELYERPATAFVAGFIGTSNLLTLRVDERGGGAGARCDLGEAGGIVARRPRRRRRPRSRSRSGPEKIKLEPAPATPAAVDGTGGRGRLPGLDDAAHRRAADGRAAGRPPAERRHARAPTRRSGDRVTLHWAAEHSFVIGAGPAGAPAPSEPTARDRGRASSVTPPGPRSRELLDRAGAVLYPGTGHGLVPSVVARKQGYTVEDVDGNVFVDLISASASVPLGAGRADIVDAGGRCAAPLRQRGQPHDGERADRRGWPSGCWRSRRPA